MRERLLRPSEAAEMLNLDDQTLANHRCKGVGIPYIKLGSRLVRYRESDILAAIESGRVVPGKTK